MISEQFDEAIVYQIPLRNRFRGIDIRHGMLLRRGERWSEWSPFPEYDDAEAATWLRAAVSDEEPPILRDRVPVNVTIPVVAPEKAAELVRAAGCATAKVKVAGAGSDLADDLARLAAVRAALGDDGKIRVDANGEWDVPQARKALSAMAKFQLEYAEQPCARVEELAELRKELAARGIAVPIAADESIRRAVDPHRVAELEAADLIIIKNQPLGGWRECLKLAELGLPMVVSSALETSIGLYDCLRLAAAIPELDHACGINTARLFNDDVVAESLIAENGYLAVGVRPTVDLDRIARLRADQETTNWWTRRLARCLAIVETSEQSGEGK